MKLSELFENTEYDFGANPVMTIDDHLSRLKINDERKPKITLKKLNSLRKLREFKKFEEMRNQSLVSIMYGGEPGTGF